MLNVIFRPLETQLDRPKMGHKSSPFGSSFTNTLDTLERELGHLKADEIVIQIDTTLDQIRNDGWPRSTARVSSPGVVLSFKSKHGALSYRCNTYGHWEVNLRAVALTLERLRAVDRYGAVKGGEQYKGWAQLPPGQGGSNGTTHAAGEWATTEAAMRFIIDLAVFPKKASGLDVEIAIKNPNVSTAWWRDAAKRAHPDAGGSNELMSKVNRAKDFIEAHRTP